MDSTQKIKNSFRMIVICMANGIAYTDAFSAVKKNYRLSYCDAQELSGYTNDLFALNYTRQKLDSMEDCAQTPEWFSEITKLENKLDWLINSLEQVMPISPFSRGGERMSVMHALSSALPKYPTDNDHPEIINKCISVTRLSDNKIVAQVNVSSDLEAHEYFCQQYEYWKYSYCVYDFNANFEFSTH